MFSGSGIDDVFIRAVETLGLFGGPHDGCRLDAGQSDRTTRLVDPPGQAVDQVWTGALGNRQDTVPERAEDHPAPDEGCLEFYKGTRVTDERSNEDRVSHGGRRHPGPILAITPDGRVSKANLPARRAFHREGPLQGE